jgi:phosphoglycerate dehydrogenase-like enzyme
MELSRPPLVVAFELSEKRKAIVADALAGASAVVYLTELDEAARAEALRNTGALLTFNTSKELRSGEAELLDGARLIQFMIAGVDFIPLGELPKGVPVAANGGGFAESMAEHALAMALAAAKRLILEHENLKLGQFNQFTRNRMLAGGVCGIFGFGGIGAATARLMYGIGMRVHAINRHGRTDERVDWIGTPERLNELPGGSRRSVDQCAAHPCHLRPDRRRRASPHEGRCHSRQPGPWGDRAGKAVV